MADELESSSAEALVSLKEGKGNTFHSQQSVSPRRGHSVRIRKPNRLFFGDEDDTPTSRSGSRKPKVSAHKGVLSTPDKKAAQAIGVRLRNLLKLPKAHKWVCYEWFYSNIDAALFEGENDFCICLRESFPQLKTKKLTRVEWCKIRRLMGKPRRCSPAFFTEERAALQQRRQKIRLLQQRKVTELASFKDLPEEIPMPLVIGTKVTARLRKPQDGLFTGVIDALDTVNNTYRVTFDRPGLGTHSIPDTEVLSNEQQDTMPLSAFQTKHRPRQNVFSPPRFVPQMSSPQLENDPLLGASPLKGKVLSMEGGTYGGFPIKFLVLVTRLSKILMVKKDCIKQLREMNTQAEKMLAFHERGISLDFQQKYASIVLELERLNKDLNEFLIGVQQFCQEGTLSPVKSDLPNTIAPEQGLASLDQPSEIVRRCTSEASDILQKFNGAASNKKMVKKEKTLQLVTNLISILLQVKTFAENDLHSFEFKSLQDTLNEIKSSLDPNNLSFFQNNVEIHVNHIQSGLSQMGNLHAFASSSINF